MPTEPPTDEPDQHHSDDLAIYAATLSIDDVAREAEQAAEQMLPQARRYYIQGIIQGQHAYLITNLLDGISQTLLQPQMVWTVGRNRQVAIALYDKGLSRRHAVIQYISRKGFCLIDLNSTNGTYVNNVRIKHRHLLIDGDCVQMGSTAFIFYISQRCKTMDAIHPEVLARLNRPEPKRLPPEFLALEEPEVVFNHITE
ncbi:MAG: FHA domain-containing protein [Leptolyngbyaceae cyanobacterium bins.59]|nr:FHA domain-containing protein [Leptolyngbyaceae cyanobacterium bins.59]